MSCSPRRAVNRRHLLCGLVLGISALATACQPDIIPTSPPPCYVGDFTMNTQQLVTPIQTSIGRETIWLVPGGSVTLSTTNGTWTLAADEQLVARGPFTGQASLHASASGTFTATDTTLTFSIGALTGSGRVSGYERNRFVNKDLQLPGSYLDDVVGLQGQAIYVCSSDGLSLDFTSLRIDFYAAPLAADP